MKRIVVENHGRESFEFGLGSSVKFEGGDDNAKDKDSFGVSGVALQFDVETRSAPAMNFLGEDVKPLFRVVNQSEMKESAFGSMGIPLLRQHDFNSVIGVVSKTQASGDKMMMEGRVFRGLDGSQDAEVRIRNQLGSQLSVGLTPDRIIIEELEDRLLLSYEGIDLEEISLVANPAFKSTSLHGFSRDGGVDIAARSALASLARKPTRSGVDRFGAALLARLKGKGFENGEGN